ILQADPTKNGGITRAGYFQTILTKNADYLQTRPKAEAFIRKRMAKMHAKAGMLEQGLRGCNRSPLLLGYFLINWTIYRIKAR
ncbi:MAG: hypothetical protein KC448_09070, partial [Yoonia sp.]|nr:hypothetical protein [Yoonia sp.]